MSATWQLIDSSGQLCIGLTGKGGALSFNRASKVEIKGVLFAIDVLVAEVALLAVLVLVALAEVVDVVDVFRFVRFLFFVFWYAVLPVLFSSAVLSPL